MSKLSNKVAVVTGGSSGIGLATAQRFIADGAQVVITARNQEALDAAVAELGDSATGIRGDVANLEDLDRLFAQVQEQFGRVDVLFANAGIAPFVQFEAVTEEHFDSLFNINVRGLFFTVQKALPLLSEGASVILNASVVAQSGLPNTSIYSATKAAVRSLGRTLAAELSPRGIRVNVVSPGAHRNSARGQTRSEPRRSRRVRSAGRPADSARSSGQARGNRRDRGVSRLRRCELLHRS